MIKSCQHMYDVSNNTLIVTSSFRVTKIVLQYLNKRVLRLTFDFKF